MICLSMQRSAKLLVIGCKTPVFVVYHIEGEFFQVFFVQTQKSSGIGDEEGKRE